MRIQGKRYNHYRDMTNWKPFHFDSAALNKDAGKGKGKGGGGKGGGGKGGGKPGAKGGGSSRVPSKSGLAGGRGSPRRSLRAGTAGKGGGSVKASAARRSSSLVGGRGKGRTRAKRLTRAQEQQQEQQTFLNSVGPEAREEARKLFGPSMNSPTLDKRRPLTPCRPFPTSPINAEAPLCAALSARDLATSKVGK